MKSELEEIIIHRLPHLRRRLRMAGRTETAELFIHRGLIFSTYLSLFGGIIAFLLFSKSTSALIALAAVPPLFILSFMYYINTPTGWINMRKRELDKDVLFAGRYILIKLECGTPLFNTLIDASRSYGVAAKYFKEIVDEINTGTPIEEALESAREYSASEKFKKLLWQLVSTIQTGTDVTTALRSSLQAIAAEQMIEIKSYGKKLNSILMFYMILACVIPSIGVTMFAIIASFMQLDITGGFLFTIMFVLMIIQLTFVSIIRSIRPMVNL